MQLLKAQAMNFLCYEDGYKQYYNKRKFSLMNQEFSSPLTLMHLRDEGERMSGREREF